MDMKKIASPFSQAKRDALFEKIFREHRIAPVDSSHVEEIRLENQHWFRRYVGHSFQNYHCIAYKIGSCIIVWESRSEKVIFITESELPFEVFSDHEYDFWLKKRIADDNFYFEHCEWNKSEGIYYVESYPEGIIPDKFVEPDKKEKRSGCYSWVKMYPHDDVETKSVDNTIFYDFIVKYWE